MKKTKGKVWIILGLLFLTAALCLTAYNLYDELRAEWSARQASERLEEQIPTEGETNFEDSGIPDYILNPNMEMPVKNVDGTGYIGILCIPSLDLKLPVISQWSYPNLKIAPCRYNGSAYLDNLVIAAHNYPSHFGSLKNLSEGDEIFFTDIDGNRFYYEVVLVETLTSASIDEMNGSGYDLTLFTCTFDGQNRVTIRCERADHH